MIPRMSKRPFAILFALVCLVSTPAFAQTGADLLLKPLVSEDELFEIRGDATFMNGGGSTNTGDPFSMSVYELSGRFREERERFIPRLGFDLAFYDFDTKDPRIPNNLIDTSIAAGVELGTFYD